MSPDIILKFALGYLRPLRVEDVHQGYFQGLNDIEVNRYLDGAKQFLQNHNTVTDFIQKNHNASDAVLFGIWEKNSSFHVGTVRLHGVDFFNKTAYIGICLFDRKVWGKGIGEKAIQAVTTWAFDSLGLRWVEAGCFSPNIASQKSFIRAGYEWIYDVPNKFLLDGRPETVKVYAARNASIP